MMKKESTRAPKLTTAARLEALEALVQLQADASKRSRDRRTELGRRIEVIDAAIRSVDEKQDQNVLTLAKTVEEIGDRLGGFETIMIGKSKNLNESTISMHKRINELEKITGSQIVTQASLNDSLRQFINTMVKRVEELEKANNRLQTRLSNTTPEQARIDSLNREVTGIIRKLGKHDDELRKLQTVPEAVDAPELFSQPPKLPNSFTRFFERIFDK